MTINNSTILTDTYSAVRTILVAASLVTTNSTTSSTTSAPVLADFNDKNSKVPCVTIKIIKSEAPRYKFSGQNEGVKTVNVLVSAYAKNTLGIDQLKQQIVTAMKATELDDLMLMEIGEDDSFMNPNEAKYQKSTITFTYNRE